MSSWAVNREAGGKGVYCIDLLDLDIFFMVIEEKIEIHLCRLL